MSNRPKVIVVDSQEKSLMYLSTLLDRMNFEVFPLQKIPELFDLAKIVKPDLFFIESTESEESSVSILEAFREDSLLSKTPVIIVGQGGPDIEKCFAAGCSDYLTKPFGLTFLNLSIQKCFPNREGMRKYLRAPYNRHISFEHNEREFKSFAVTLSEGGVYIRTTRPLPVGEKVKLHLSLSGGDEAPVDGTVIYTMGLNRGAFLIPPGMAVQFDECDDNAKAIELIRTEVSRLLIGDIVEEQDDSIFEL